MRIARSSLHYAIVGAMLVSTWMLVPPIAHAQNTENPEVTRLLADARDKAAVLSRDADEMESLIRTDASWQTHAAMLDEVKRHVNDLGRAAQKLEESRSSASPWQQQAIDRMMPLLKELAANTTAAINHLNENRIRPTTGNYPEYLKENAETAQQLSDMISSYVRYGQTREKLEKLEQRLEVARK